jgi:hypothetical protein
MSRFAGLWKIARFNWPWYAAAAGVTVVFAVSMRAGVMDRHWAVPGAAGIALADFWLLTSLAVSHYIYDRSPVARGGWIRDLAPDSIHRAGVFHAGQDEASGVIARQFPASDIRVFDFFVSGPGATASLRRARSLARSRDQSIEPGSIPVGDGDLDLEVVAFAAHEIREPAQRRAFFRELARVLAPAGRLFVVEHPRDGWNLLAYGPGSFHFYSRKTWRDCIGDSGLHLLRETACTPFVRVFEIGKPS